MKMRFVYPAGALVLGVFFIIMSSRLDGPSGPAFVVNNLVSLAMLASGTILVLVGCVTFFIRDDEDMR